MQDHALHRAKILIYAKGNPTEIWCKLKFTSSVYVSLRCLKQRFPSCFRLSVYVVNELKNGTLFPSHFRRRILVFTLTGMYVYEKKNKGSRCRILHINAKEIWNFRVSWAIKQYRWHQSLCAEFDFLFLKLAKLKPV